ncbi:hypothetical protein ABIF86_000363 [Bradyrhizobium japonicum]
MQNRKGTKIAQERLSERHQMVRERRGKGSLAVGVQREDRLKVSASQSAQYSEKLDQFAQQFLVRPSQLQL